MIIDELNLTPKDVFVDLGSGVGQVVAQIAGGSRVKQAFGIEIAKLPADFAARLEEEFRKYANFKLGRKFFCLFCRLARFYGLKFRPFSLERGDFLSAQFRKIITEDATVIFINNYAFQADLEMRIKNELISELRDGTRIISTMPYAPLNKAAAAMTERSMSRASFCLSVLH